MSRIVFHTVTVLGAIGISFGAGLYAGARQNAVFQAAWVVGNSLTTVWSELSVLMGAHPTHFLQPSHTAGDGVTVNARPGDGALILLSGFFDRSIELRLIRRDGAIVARWPVAFFSIFPDPTHFPPGATPATDWNIDTHGALALPDGSVVFNFEYGGLVKLDRCGGIVWTLAHQTHHSVQRAEGGGFWVPGRRFVPDGPSSFPPFEPPYHEDLILRVSDAGQIIAEYSVPRILYDNGLEGLLTASGAFITTGFPGGYELVHLNEIEELSTALAPDFPMFKPGDLVLSLRDHNLILVVDGQGARVKWWKIGPWRRQHDPEFRRGGTITLFNNNVYGRGFGGVERNPRVVVPRASNIADINPATGEYRILYGAHRNQDLHSTYRGKVQVTRSGLLITEPDGGRALEIDQDGTVVWEYVNRFSADEVAGINEARLYPADYFQVQDWSCAPQ